MEKGEPSLCRRMAEQKPKSEPRFVWSRFSQGDLLALGK